MTSPFLEVLKQVGCRLLRFLELGAEDKGSGVVAQAVSLSGLLMAVVHVSLGGSELQSNDCLSSLSRGTQCAPHSRSQLICCHLILYPGPWPSNVLFVFTVLSPLL